FMTQRAVGGKRQLGWLDLHLGDQLRQQFEILDVFLAGVLITDLDTPNIGTRRLAERVDLQEDRSRLSRLVGAFLQARGQAAAARSQVSDRDGAASSIHEVEPLSEGDA